MNQIFEKPTDHRPREQQRRRVAQGLRDILKILNSNRSLDEILLYLIAQSCRILNAPIGAMYNLDHEENCLLLRAAQGINGTEGARKISTGWGTPGQVVLTRQIIAIADTGAAPDSTDNPLSQFISHDLSHCFRALLAVPVIIKDEVYGVIILYYHESHQFSPEELQIAAVLSDQTALAIENARLVSAVQDKAILEERQRIARDLHDSVTQGLYGISLYAEAAMRRLEAGDTVIVARHLHALQETTLEALQEMRLLIFELRPPLLAQEGLTAALQTRLEAVEGRSKMETKFLVEELPELPAATEQSLYRIAQEALNNTLRHAHAEHVTVLLRAEQGVLLLEIIDDGIGFNLAVAEDHGCLGLRGIQERVHQLGGRLSIQSAPGMGTVVRVEIAL